MPDSSLPPESVPPTPDEGSAQPDAPPKQSAMLARSSLLWNISAAALGLIRSYQYNARVADAEHDKLTDFWNKTLADARERDDRRDAISRAYEGASDRGIRVEAKAIGYLQILAIAAAIVTFVLTRDAAVLRVLSVVALVYLTTAAVGCLAVLRVSSRRQALTSDATSPTFGLAEAAVAAASMEQQHTQSSNFISGAAHDLVMGGLFALVSLILMVFGIGAGADSPTDPPPRRSHTTQPAETSATESPAAPASTSKP